MSRSRREAPKMATNSHMAPAFDSRITLHKLEVLCLVVDLGGVSRAAEHLWVAQPVVTAHIRSLQERIGVTLFRREGRRTLLTDAGRQVYAWAQDVLARTEQMRREVDELANGSRGPIAVAASMSLGSYLLPPVLSDFQERFPEAEITLVVEDPEGAVTSVERGESDVAFIVAPSPPQNPALACELVGFDELVLVAARDFRPGLEEVTIAELGRLPLVSTPRSHLRRELVDRQLSHYGVRGNVVIELGHPEAMKHATRAGLGACLLFRAAVEHELLDGSLVEIAVTDASFRVPVYLVRRLSRPLTPVQTVLVNTLRQHFPSPLSVDKTPIRSTVPE
jgi:LysR family transcriptional regulator, low CO2-responsive transcriptional regulator